MNKEPARIWQIKEECREDISTFFFDKSISTTPGRFVTAWIPDYGEKPFSISYEGSLGITVKRIEKYPENPMRGRFTNKLFEMKEGDYVWLTEPKGKGFPIRSFNGKVCLVGGGSGIALLAFLSKRIPAATEVVSFLGAKTADEMIMENRFHGRVYTSTDDGSYGEKGFVTDILEKYKLESLRGSETKAAICGPEKMMYKAAEILEEYIPPENIYVSVERLMKCSVGLCGSCDFGGYRVCQDGPVFTYQKIKSIPDFGKFKRNRCGGKELL